MGSVTKRFEKNAGVYNNIINKFNEKLNELQKQIDPEKSVDLSEQVKLEVAKKNEQRRKNRNKRKHRNAL
jgi:hypothetical protein